MFNKILKLFMVILVVASITFIPDRAFAQEGIPSPAHWMQDSLSPIGNKQLKQISITGSHDSGMSEINGKTLGATPCNVLTQSQDVKGQLMLGARYFDIRPVIHAGEYYTGHYSDVRVGKVCSSQGANGQSIESIIQDVNEFTSESQELVVLNLSHSLNTDVDNLCYSSFNQDEWNNLFAQLSKLNHLYKVTNDPENVDLTSFTLSSFIQENPAVIVVVEDSSANLGKYLGQGFYHYDSFNVYNSYSDTNNLQEMEQNQLKKMKEQTGKSYFLLSWTLTQSSYQALTCSKGLSHSIKYLANEANGSLLDVVYPVVSESSFPNIIYTDNIIGSEAALLAVMVNNKLYYH